ncbi:MAG: type II secretion system F family protein [Vulcanimicrobiota bacterium]
MRIPFQALALFTRQLVTLLQGGVPLVRSLEALSLQSEYPAFGEVVRDITHKVESGHRFSDSLSRYPLIFPKIYVVMVEIGEHSGGLDHSMERLAGWLERDGQLRQRIRSALTYPAFILALAACLTLIIFYCVMPAFMGIFTEMQVELPLITRFTLGVTNAVRSPTAWLATVLLLAGVVRQVQRAWEDPGGRLFLYSLALQIPLLGGILWNGAASRYCSAAETLLNSGSGLERTLRLSASVSGSPLLQSDSARLTGTVSEGNLASEHMLEHSEIYSTTMAHMAAAGEEASRLPEMFGRAGDFHALEMEGQVETLKAALEPMMLAAVALVVGTVILSVFLPLYGFLSRIA